MHRICAEERASGLELLERRNGHSTRRQIYEIIYKEVLSAAAPGQTFNRAPRIYVSMIAALERLIMKEEASPCPRVFSWWMLMQNWRTLRFSHHKSIKPMSVHVTFSALLTRSQTIGRDKAVRSLTAHWMELLAKAAPHDRDKPSARSWLVTRGPMSATTLLTRSKDVSCHAH